VTFIVNLLHKDFSILLSDKKANTDGPTTIKVGKITVRAEKGATIIGFQKIFLSGCNLVALGIAGNANKHSYINDLPGITNIDDALKLVRSHMEHFLGVHNRSEIMQQQSSRENQSIATFFDRIESAYFSNLFLFSKIHNHTMLYKAPERGGMLIHVGSGSNIFEKTIGKNEIERFASSVASIDMLAHYLEWFSGVFKKISEVDDGVGEDFTGVISTRESPNFVRLNMANN